MRTYLTEQLDLLMRNSKGCFLLSKLKKKMVYQFLTYISQICFSSLMQYSLVGSWLTCMTV